MVGLLAGCFGVSFVAMFFVLGIAFTVDGLWYRFEFVGGHCPKCNYDVSGILRSRRCPECGTRFTEGDTIRTVYRRNYLELTVGAVFLAVGIVLVFGAARIF